MECPPGRIPQVDLNQPARLALRHRPEIRIQDEEPGLQAAEIERVFEPFHRLDAFRSRETGGTGLGLAIARRIAVGHGGEVTLEDRPEGGLEVRLILPRSEATPTPGALEPR
jgi:signal transduction histidine kinase